MNHLVVDVQGVEFSYGASKPVCQIKNFQLKKSENIFLYGPSGCGKSTLLGLISGVLNAKKGSLKILGHEFCNSSASFRDNLRGEKMGYIFQMFNLVPYLSVLDNIILPCQINKNRRAKFSSPNEMLDSAKELIETFQINSIMGKKVTEISIGQQQRVAAARALLGNPDLILADEPTSAMDLNLQTIFLERLLKQCEKQNTSLIFVSHDRSLSIMFSREVSFHEINGVSHV